MNEKLLYVDDDPNILRAYERSMRKFFRMDTAPWSQEVPPGVMYTSFTSHTFPTSRQMGTFSQTLH